MSREGVCDGSAAPFATAVLALDHCTLDAVLRKLKLFQDLPRGEPQLLGGQLPTLFDLRRQLFYRVEFWEDAQQNEKYQVEHWLTWIPTGALLLFDLGFYAFRWFDTLTARGIYFVSRQRHKISSCLHCVLYDGPAGPVRLRESLTYLGALVLVLVLDPICPLPERLNIRTPEHPSLQTFSTTTSIPIVRMIPAARLHSGSSPWWTTERPVWWISQVSFVASSRLQAVAFWRMPITSSQVLTGLSKTITRYSPTESVVSCS